MSEAELVAAITRDRAARKRIGLAIVCFDTLNLDVVRTLQSVAAAADRTIAIVMDDEAVRVKMGEGRPVVIASDRAELVDAVRGVDYVILCSRHDVERLIPLLMPDVRA